MAKMNEKTNGATKVKKDVEANKAAAHGLLGQKQGSEAMPKKKKNSY